MGGGTPPKAYMKTVMKEDIASGKQRTLDEDYTEEKEVKKDGN